MDNWTDTEMGIGAKALWTQIWTEESNQKAGFGELYCWLHPRSHRAIWLTGRMNFECGWSFKQHGGRHRNCPHHSRRIYHRAVIYLRLLGLQQRSRVWAVLAGLRIVTTFRVTGLKVQCDSSLVVNQVSGEYITRNAQMAKYLQLVLAQKSKSLDATSNGSPNLKTITLTYL